MMKKKRLNDCGFIDHPHEVEIVDVGFYRCYCGMSGTLAHLIAHVVKTQAETKQ